MQIYPIPGMDASDTTSDQTGSDRFQAQIDTETVSPNWMLQCGYDAARAVEFPPTFMHYRDSFELGLEHQGLAGPNQTPMLMSASTVKADTGV